MGGQSRADVPPMARLAPLHALWRALPAERRRALLFRVACTVAPRPDRPAPLAAPGAVAIAGELGRASGLGEGARIMLGAARALGLDATAIGLGLVPRGEGAELGPVGGGAGQGEVVPGRALLLHGHPTLLPLASLRLGRRTLRRRPVIGCLVWELPVAPEGWRRAAGFVHAIWTPSRFAAAALETVLPGRVRVVPHPLAAVPPRPAPIGRAAFGLPDDAVVVLASFSLASSFARKNPLAAIAAFRRAFGDRADRVLVLKVGKSDHAPADLARLRAAAAGAANIRFELRTLDAPTTHALTASADIALSLHRSEGFGLFAAEAMMLGRTVVATDWSGTTDFLDRSCGVPVGHRLVPVVDARGIYAVPGATWAEVDVEQAAAALRALADDPVRRTVLGRAAARRASQAFDVEPFRSALVSIGVIAPPR